MSIREDRIEQERIARQTAIKQALQAEDGSKTDQSEPTEQPKAEPTEQLVPYDQDRDGTIRYRRLKDWEAIDSKGRVFQFRPMTSAEVEAETDRMFLKQQFEADQAHCEHVKAAIREQEREQKYLDQKREKEQRTGKRSMRTDMISLSEARRRGYLQSSNASSGKPEWWSPGNPDGIMGGGR